MRRALRLQAKSNPTVVEWLNSPIVYCEQGSHAAQTRALLSEYYHRPKGFYHYRNTAKSNYQQFLRDDVVKLKKYFYVLRPLLAVRWLEQYGGVAPIEFDRLRQVLADDALQAAIDGLLTQKRQHGEAEKQPVVPVLQRWIEQELVRLEHFVVGDDGSADARAMQALNGLFLSLVQA